MTVHRFPTPPWPLAPRPQRPEDAPSVGFRIAGAGCLAACVASALVMLAVVTAGSVWVVTHAIAIARAALGY